MNRTSERATLVRYFLGELQAGEQREVEERYFCDLDYSELRDDVEAELVNAYVDGELSFTERQHFQTNYLTTGERVRNMQFQVLLQRYRQLRLSKRPSRATALSWFRSRPALALAAAASVALIIFPYLLLTREWLSPKPPVVSQSLPEKVVAPQARHSPPAPSAKNSGKARPRPVRREQPAVAQTQTPPPSTRRTVDVEGSGLVNTQRRRIEPSPEQPRPRSDEPEPARSAESTSKPTRTRFPIDESWLYAFKFDEKDRVGVRLERMNDVPFFSAHIFLANYVPGQFRVFLTVGGLTVWETRPVFLHRDEDEGRLDVFLPKEFGLANHNVNVSWERIPDPR